MTNRSSQLKLDKSAFSTGSLHDDEADIAYWKSRTPAQRLEA